MLFILYLSMLSITALIGCMGIGASSTDGEPLLKTKRMRFLFVASIIVWPVFWLLAICFCCWSLVDYIRSGE